LVQREARRRIGEPVTAVAVRGNVVRRIQPLAHVGFRDRGDRPVMFVSRDTAARVLARDLPSLEVECVAVAVVRWIPKYGDAAVIVNPSPLDAHRHVAPHEVLALTAPGRAFGPLAAGPEPVNGAVVHP